MAKKKTAVKDVPLEAKAVAPVVVEAKDKTVKVYGIDDREMVIGPYEVRIKKGQNHVISVDIVDLLVSLGAVTRTG